MRKKIMLRIVCAACLAALLAITISGAEIDRTQDGRITVCSKYDAVPLEGIELQLYQVATIDAAGNFLLTEDFKPYPVDLGTIQNGSWRELAQTLSAYAVRDHLPAMDQAVSDSTGTVRFPHTGKRLPVGLYLVQGNSVRKADHQYRTVPFLVSIPTWDTGYQDWSYDVTVLPKYEKDPIPEHPDGQTTERKVVKIWKEDTATLRPNEITVQLLKNNQVYDTVRLNRENQWRYHWENLPRYDSDGREISWTITEQNVKHYTVSIAQTGNTFILTNTRVPEGTPGDPSVQIRVKKTWSDQGHEKERPNSVTALLYKNSVLYDSKDLSAANDWTYTWRRLPKQERDGTPIVWTVTEKYVPGYRAEMFRSGNYFEIINQFVEERLPQTGILWWPIPILVLAGVVSLIWGVAVRKKHE